MKKSTIKDSPKLFATTVRQLLGDECKAAMSLMSHSNDRKVVQDKIKETHTGKMYPRRKSIDGDRHIK